MEDKNPRVGERMGGRGDEEMIGRESSAMRDRKSGSPAAQTRRERSTTSGAAIGYPASAAAGRDDDVPEQRTREIRAEIEHTRGEMSETVNAIQDRLRPGAIAANAAESVKQTASQAARDIAESDSVQYVRSNPIPTAMVGIGIAGLAWLALGGRKGLSSERRPYGSTGRDGRTTAGYGDTDSGSKTGAMTDDMRRRAGQTAHRAQDQLRRTWDQSPFLIGAAAAVLGAIIGSAVPETERENQLMGETRDNLVESVESTVRDKVSQVQDAAKNAAGQVQETAAKAVGLGSGESNTGRSSA